VSSEAKNEIKKERNEECKWQKTFPFDEMKTDVSRYEYVEVVVRRGPTWHPLCE
jgi:hypothetical protein